MLVSIVFIALLFGIVQMGIVFFTVNFANEATRHVARTAVVCDTAPARQAAIKARIVELLPAVFKDGTDIAIDYNSPAACIVNVNSTTPCVTVTITPGVEIPNFIPFWDFSWPVWRLQALRTTLTPESLADGTGNPVCN